MAFDAHKNLAVSTIVTAPSPATSGTSLVVTASEGARFPAPPFNATVWPSSAMPTPANAEVVRVTARTTDTLTIARAQEGTTARAMAAGDLLAASITAKTLTDLETQAALLAAANVFTAEQTLRMTKPKLVLDDTSEAANARRLDLWNELQGLHVHLFSDAGVYQATPLIAYRTGDVKVLRDLYEKGRAQPVGHWTTGDVATYTHTPGLTGPIAWAVVGKVLFLNMAASGAVAAGSTQRITIPGGYTSLMSFGTPVLVIGTNAYAFGSAHFGAAGSFFDVIQNQNVAWPAMNISIQFSISIPIQ